MSGKSKMSRGIGNALVSVVLGILAVPVILMIVGAAFWGLVLAGAKAASVEGPAPEGSYAVRREWGEENLRKYFLAAEKWIRNNENIENDIGPVTGVAPVGGPNKYHEGFGECWATMNLQVIGEKGEGVCGLSEVSFDGHPNKPYVEMSKTPWRFQLHASPE